MTDTIPPPGANTDRDTRAGTSLSLVGSSTVSFDSQPGLDPAHQSGPTTVAVAFGLGSTSTTVVRVQANGGVNDISALGASIGHLTRVRDEPVRLEMAANA